LSLRERARQTLSFGVIGTIGFAVDGGILTLLHSLQGVALLPARLCSFAIAVTVTWSLNRRLTFPGGTDGRALRQWLRYAAANGIGALLNLAIFLWLAYRFDAFAAVPLVPLAIASLVAMVFNFLASKYLVFRGVRV
jgi:putative flippase GtrA